MEHKKDNLDDTLDWEYMSGFYKEEGKAVRSFEEYQKEQEEYEQMERLAEKELLSENEDQKLLTDIRRIRELDEETGKTVKEIAQELQLEEEYVTTILITLHSNQEDISDLAIARLVEMG